MNVVLPALRDPYRPAVAVLQDYDYVGLAGDPHVLLCLHDGDGRKVSGLFDRTAPFIAWRRRRFVRRLRKEWCARYVR